jgi:hypothetical protein
MQSSMKGMDYRKNQKDQMAGYMFFFEMLISLYACP